MAEPLAYRLPSSGLLMGRAKIDVPSGDGPTDTFRQPLQKLVVQDWAKQSLAWLHGYGPQVPAVGDPNGAARLSAKFMLLAKAHCESHVHCIWGMCLRVHVAHVDVSSTEECNGHSIQPWL